MAVGSNLVQIYFILLNPEPNFRSGSAKVLNFELNFGPVLKGSGSNFGNTTGTPRSRGHVWLQKVTVSDSWRLSKQSHDQHNTVYHPPILYYY